MTKVSELIANYKSPASPARFLVEIPGASRGLLMKCNASKLPGFSLGVMERHTYGPQRRYPISQIYQEIDMSFYCSEDHSERKFFEQWFGRIYERATYDFDFYKNFVRDITISQLGKKGTKTYSIKLQDAYPILISPIELDYGNTNSYERFDVSFVYFKSIPPGGTGFSLGSLGLPIPSLGSGALNFLGDAASALDGVLGGLGEGIQDFLLGGSSVLGALGGLGQDILSGVNLGRGLIDQATALIGDVNFLSGDILSNLTDANFIKDQILNASSYLNTIDLGNLVQDALSGEFNAVLDGAQNLIGNATGIKDALNTLIGDNPISSAIQQAETLAGRAMGGMNAATSLVDSALGTAFDILGDNNIIDNQLVAPVVDSIGKVTDIIDRAGSIGNQLHSVLSRI